LPKEAGESGPQRPRIDPRAGELAVEGDGRVKARGEDGDHPSIAKRDKREAGKKGVTKGQAGKGRRTARIETPETNPQGLWDGGQTQKNRSQFGKKGAGRKTSAGETTPRT